MTGSTGSSSTVVPCIPFVNSACSCVVPLLSLLHVAPFPFSHHSFPIFMSLLSLFFSLLRVTLFITI
ncbi:hypothetical protein BJV78DRAFT_1218975, partial [Lactifluus subvellereus]